MEKIQPGKYVELGYDLYEVTPAGENLVHQTDAQDPEKIIFGVTPGMIRPLEKAIEGLEAGGEFDVTVKAAEAFGPHDPDQVASLEKDVFAVDGKFDSEMVKKGAVLPMMTSDGYRINGLVVDVTDDEVEMDFNHPLAGKDVRFKGSIITVREATPEELQPAHGCGCGCHHGGEDSCGCHGDGTDSCGCSDHEGCGCH
ncbi:FKBP-type peptidyl-prolyl cis-trans isomerase [Paramuribaculum intestinale]|jgi:FKBP-type peptidyl-prolyl cis-trans isomerases 2|uniref:FKBP-type peptidyl-prolyl cis-trans isomerase n=1 Tax=Paramuribaculum intestinale TaxID=2094151 RepID=UPI0025B21CA4|nr:FKBP-type peptidyl-prolyl cis-trans isomerase [Paramuribaculum intestinale]